MDEVENPLVSVTIPTRNSARTIGASLASIRAQTYPHVETIIVDGYSQDSTVAVANQFGCKLILSTKPLLDSRIRGIEESHGRHILLMDSDQELSPDCIARSVSLAPSYDMLCLGENTSRPDLFVPRLLECSRRVVQSNPERYMNPYSGLMLPRFFEGELLRRAAAAISADARSFVSDRDHQILFYEASKLGRAVGFLPGAVRHTDLNTLPQVWKKSVHWGLGAGRLYTSGLYKELLTRRFSFRVSRPDGFARISNRDKVGANCIAVFKGVPYTAGFLWAQLRVGKASPT
jgi:glycosyltransferase involved in cell wall biosynthesis